MKNSQTVQPVEVDEETDTLNRTKRQVNDVSQHLDEDPDKIPSKDLPLEHRGLDDEEEFDDSVDHSHHHHPHHGRKSNGSATSQLSVVLTLFTALYVSVDFVGRPFPVPFISPSNSPLLLLDL